MAGSIILFDGKDFILRPDKAEIYSWLKLDEGLPAYAAHEAAWEEAQDAFERAVDIRCCIHIKNRQSADLFLTLGAGAEQGAAAAFLRGDYVLGSLINSLADQAVFRLDMRTGMLLTKELAARGLYAKKRREAPFDYPLSAQAGLFEPMRGSLPDVRVLHSGLFVPAKSMMYSVDLSDDPREEGLPKHDCARCRQKDCPYRGLRG